MIRYKRAASQDSEEAANIGISQASSDGIRVNTNSIDADANVFNNSGGSGNDSSGANRQAKEPINGHHDPKQRKIYLIIFAFSLINALIGLSLIITWMFKYRAVTGIGTDAAGLSNLHPIMMFTFMISLNMYSVLVYRTHYSQAKDKLKWAHAILSGLNIVMSLLGVLAMFKAHLMAGLPNFYSLHSWLGVLTNTFYLTQFITGFVSFMKPGITQKRKIQLMPWHRMAGGFILCLAALAAITGISELVIFQDKNGAYANFTPITFIANFAGLSILLMTASTIYLLASSQYKRPRLSEEEPLKR